MGMLGGYFVVPLNALLQHRGHLLMGAGHSIAIQNFNENLSILALSSAYSGMLRANLHIFSIVVIFGLFISVFMALLWRRFRDVEAHV
jgi:cytochrome c oxidase subunit IV